MAPEGRDRQDARDEILGIRTNPIPVHALYDTAEFEVQDENCGVLFILPVRDFVDDKYIYAPPHAPGRRLVDAPRFEPVPPGLTFKVVYENGGGLFFSASGPPMAQPPDRVARVGLVTNPLVQLEIHWVSGRRDVATLLRPWTPTEPSNA